MQKIDKQINEVSYSEKVADRFIGLCKEGKIMYPDELKIFTYLAEKYDPVTVSDYSRITKKAYKIIKEWIDKGKLACISIGNVKFVLKGFN